MAQLMLWQLATASMESYVKDCRHSATVLVLLDARETLRQAPGPRGAGVCPVTHEGRASFK
eukprot:10974163-Heterocapsa_arctica.AAC.1